MVVNLKKSVLAFAFLASPALADSKAVLEVEEVETPSWVIEETEEAMRENRAAKYRQAETIVLQEEEPKDDDDDILPFPTEDEEKPKKKKKSKIPPMDPKGGVKDAPKKGSKDEATEEDGDEDPFPDDSDEDPFPDDSDDPFPDDDDIPGFPDDDPFPPVGDDNDGGLPGFDDPFFPDPGFGLDTGPVAIADQIVNLGHKLWKIIQENQPVIKADYKYANAIPEGTDPTELEYFSPVQYKSFKIKLKNRFDSTVVDITYTTVHRYGGKYEGQGQFLERVSIVPSKVVVGYNYKVNFNVTNVTVANVGSIEEPIASMGVDALIEYGSTFKKTSRRIMFEFRGDSAEVKQYRVD